MWRRVLPFSGYVALSSFLSLPPPVALDWSDMHLVSYTQYEWPNKE